MSVFAFQVVPNVYALKNHSNINDKMLFKTLGNDTPLDGGADEYIYLEGNFNTENGATVIRHKNNGGSFLSLGGISKNKTLHVDQLGAYGDGIHDDTTAINNAIAVLSLSGGGVLNFDGVYRLTENTTSSTQTRFTISSDNVTLVFSSKTKFLVKSDSAITIVFALAGVNHFKSVGTLHVVSDTTTPYSTAGAYGAKALVIYNANGASSAHINIEKVLITRGSGGVFVSNAYAASNRVTNVSIGEIRTFDATYGFNAQNNGDGVDIGLVYTYNAYRSYFAYGCESHRANVDARAQHTGGTPINLTTYSVAEGGSGVNTDDMVINLSVSNGGLESTIATLRNVGDGGASQKVGNIQLRIHTDYTPTTVLALFNFNNDAGSASSTVFDAKIENIFIECNTPLATTPIVYSPCKWTTKPNIVWQGMSGATVNQSSAYQEDIDFRLSKVGAQYFKDEITLENNVGLNGLSSAGVSLPLAKVDVSNNVLYGGSSGAATYTVMYAGMGGIYFNVNGSSRFQASDSQFRPQTDNTYL